MRGVVSPRKPTASEISQQTKEMFDNVGLDIPPNEVKSEDQAAELIKHLVNMIQSSSEWDDIIAAETQAMSYINGGALKFDNFKKSLPDLYLGLTYAATSTRSALVKSSCLLIALLAKELGPNFDNLGDYVTPLAKQLSNGTQFISDCSKNAIITISKYCPGRKTFQTILSLCSSKGSQQKLVASICLHNIMLQWPSESLGTNWPRFYVVLSKFLEDASPFVRQNARKTARSIKVCSKQRSVEFFSRIDSNLKKKILDETDDCVYKPQKKVPRVASEEQPPAKPKPAKKQPVEDFKPKQNDMIRNYYKPETSQKPKPARPHSSIPVRTKKTEHKVVVEEPQPKAPACSFDAENDEISPFTFDRPTQRQFYRLSSGHELEYVTRIRDVIERGCVSEISNSMKDVSQDLVRCILQDDSKLCVSSLAAVHDLLPTFPDFFDPHCATIIHRCLQLCTSSNDPRVVSNAKIILDNVSNYMNCKTIISSCEKEQPSLFLLSLILSCISSDRCLPYLSDSVVRSSCLTIAIDTCEISGERSMELSRQVFKMIYDKCGEASLTEYETQIYFDEKRLNSFKEICSHDTQNILTSIDTNVSEYKNGIPDLKEFNNDIKSWSSSMETFCNSFDERTWNHISSSFCLSKISDVIVNNVSKQDVLPALYLIQRIIASRGTSSFSSFMYSVMLCKSVDKYKRAVENILNTLSIKVETIKILSALQPLIRSSNKEVSSNAVIFERQVLQSCTSSSLRPACSDVICSLCDILDFEQDISRPRRVLCSECLADIALLIGQSFYNEGRYTSLSSTSKGMVEFSISSRK